MTRMRRCWPFAFMLAALASGRASPAAAQGTAAAGENPTLDVGARVMFWADASQRESVPGQDEAITDFFVRRARVLLQGRASRSFSFLVQVGQDNVGAKVLTDDGSIRIKDAYINYRAADAFQVALGQFKIPFLRANLQSGFNQILVDRGTLPTLRPAREGSRDLGAMAWGNSKGLQYRVAFFDGSDQERGNSSSSVRVTTRLAYNWFTKETGFGYTGSYLGRSRVLQLAGQLDVQDGRLDPRDESSFASLARDYRTYALEGFFEQPFAGAWTITVDGAWFDRRDDYREPGVATRTLQGHYLQAGVLLPVHIGSGRLQLAARREDWDTERGAAEATTTRTTAGATYYLKGHDRKLQADYTRKREAVEIDNDEFRLSVVLVF